MQEFENYPDRKPTDVEPKKQVVLVVDDARTMRASITRILEQDFQILEAQNGEQAWNIIIHEPLIHVVISDLLMPVKNGFRLLRQIRASDTERISHLPVIMITGHEDTEKMKYRAMALGASDFISKPFDSIQILARARAYAKHGDTHFKLDQTRKALRQQSTIDTLTGLANPRFFQEHGSSLLAFAVRQGSNVAMLHVNIDKFDLLEQKKGKQVADKVLLNISKIINASVRREDSVARIGRAKFAVVMLGSDESGARVLADRMHRLIGSAIYRLGEVKFRVTASAGLVYQPKTRQTPFEQLVKEAERRLNSAIEGGGNKLVLESTIDAEETTVARTQQPVSRYLSVDEALVLLKAEQSEELCGQLKVLLGKVYPLLEFSNRELDLGLDSALIKLRENLSTVQSPIPA